MASNETSGLQEVARVALGLGLIFAGTSHLTFARKEFKAQVPDFVTDIVPQSTDAVVLQSGVAEIALGSALAFLPKQKKAVGWVAAGFFAAVFPGNVAQWQHRRSAFGLDTDEKRFARLFFQPVLVAWALWASGATRKS